MGVGLISLLQKIGIELRPGLLVMVGKRSAYMLMLTAQGCHPALGIVFAHKEVMKDATPPDDAVALLHLPSQLLFRILRGGYRRPVSLGHYRIVDSHKSHNHSCDENDDKQSLQYGSNDCYYHTLLTIESGKFPQTWQDLTFFQLLPGVISSL